MANPDAPWAQVPPVLDIEKGDDDIDGLSIESSSSSSRYGKEALPQPLSVTRNNDIEAYPITANEQLHEKYDIATAATRTSTRSGWADAARVVTRMSTKSSWKDPGPPPDGGLAAWTQVAMAHLVVMNTWGLINSFGVFQSYYVEALRRPPSDIAWIGSIQVFLLFSISTFTGRLTDAGYFRQVFFVGALLQVLGFFMASLSTQYWQVFLAQGVSAGLGNGFIFCPMLTLLSTYFSKKRSLAIGIAAAGSATGGLAFPAMVQQLLPIIGFGWTMRALGLVEFVCLAIAITFSKPRLPPRRAGPIVEWSAFKEAPYALLAVGMFFNFWGVYFAFYYLGSFAHDMISLSYTESINLILVLNGVGVVGRIIPNHYADQLTGPLNMLIPVSAICSITLYSMVAVNTRGGLYGWSIIYGSSAAAIQSLFPATLSSLTTDLRKAGVRMGMIFSIVSFAVLTGPPISGALIQKGDGRFIYGQIFSGTTLMIGTIFLIGARIAKSGLVFKVKV